MTYVHTDGGRAAAGYKGDARDCVVRAIAIAAQLPYQQVYDALKAAAPHKSPRTGVFTKTVWFRRFMVALGWTWEPTMFVGQGCKVHLCADELPPGRIICSVSRHYVAVIDGVIHDNHDSRRNGRRCVYGYWRRVA